MMSLQLSWKLSGLIRNVFIIFIGLFFSSSLVKLSEYPVSFIIQWMDFFLK
jgi:hypothetical protein